MMRVSSNQLERFAWPTLGLLLSLVVLAWMAQPVGAETLRTDLYRFDVLGSSSPASPSDPHVYMRVSNADRLISNPAEPAAHLSAEASDRVALFEFFLDSKDTGYSLSRVRFGGSPDRPSPFTRLHSICSSRHAGPLHAAADIGEGDFSVDLPGSGRAGEVVGLMLELSPSESIDTLLDTRLPCGAIRPEVELRLPSGSTVWLRVVRPLAITSGSPYRGSSIFAADSCPPISITPRIHLADVRSWTFSIRDHRNESSADYVVWKVPSAMLHCIRARGPPRVVVS